jgi:hypothetical protein
MMGEKVVEKKLEIGQWKFNLSNVGGYGMEVVNVSLRGLRNRPYFLSRISNEVFFTRHPKGPDGKPQDPVVLLRGTPAMYTVLANQLLVWPAPASDGWTLQVRLRKRERVEEGSAVHPGSDAA